MARVTATEVRVIITTSLLDAAIEAYIEIANPMVTETVTCGLSASALKEIERWLTAHLISITQERLAVKKRLGEAEITYANVYGDGFKSTQYGKMVLQLDSCGGFANLGKKAISFKAITSPEF